MAPSYLFDNARPQAGQGFSSIEATYDAWTIRQLEGIGVAGGWRCLEVGGGGGSIGRWLASRVGPEGRVTVTAAQRLTRYEQIGEEAVASGRITAAELERACALLRHPACPVLTPGMLISARGRRPG
jgi:hypothetical protein